MVCIGKNIANCSKNPQFLPVMCVLCPRCAHMAPMTLASRQNVTYPCCELTFAAGRLCSVKAKKNYTMLLIYTNIMMQIY